MKWKDNIGLVFLLMTLLACQKESEQKQRFLALSAFNKITVVDPMEVYLSEGSGFSAEILGSEAAVDDLHFEVRDSVLWIEDKRKAKWRTPNSEVTKVYITSLPLKQLTADGGVYIQTNTPITTNDFGLILTGKSNEANLEVRGDGFYYWNNFPCGGKVTLRGKVKTLKLWNVALMAIDAKSLITDYAEVANASKGEIEVYVRDRLDYSITGEGNVSLYGNPKEINLNEKSSSGELIKK